MVYLSSRSTSIQCYIAVQGHPMFNVILEFKVIKFWILYCSSRSSNIRCYSEVQGHQTHCIREKDNLICNAYWSSRSWNVQYYISDQGHQTFNVTLEFKVNKHAVFTCAQGHEILNVILEFKVIKSLMV